MYRLLINLYEFGQFLRILLWISVPLCIISMLVTTWLHYRRKRRVPEELLLSLHGVDRGNGMVFPAMLESAAEISGNGQEPLHEEEAADPGATLEPEEKENIYKGILWMKQKYEQYRDMADRRYEQLKEQLARAEKKYQDLVESRQAEPGTPGHSGAVQSVDLPVASTERPTAAELSEAERASYPALLEEKNRQIAYLQQQLDQRIKNFYQAEIEGRENKSRMLELEELQLRTRYLLEEKQAYIDQLEGQLVAERRKIEDLVTKLQASSQHLLTIYQELERSTSDPLSSAGEPLNSPNEP